MESWERFTNAAESMYMFNPSNAQSGLHPIHLWVMQSQCLRLFHCHVCRKLVAVHYGKWNAKNQPEQEVTVKVLTQSAGEDERVKFRREAETVADLLHRNVVELFGVVDHEKQVSHYRKLKCISHTKELISAIGS